jgi:hypothetical protein
MALNIETFSNEKGGNAFFKAIGHPVAARQGPALLQALAEGPLALYDPFGYAPAFAALYDLSSLDIAGVYVQDIEDIGREFLGQAALPVTALPDCKAERVFVTAFDAEGIIGQIKHLLPRSGGAPAAVLSLDALRLPQDMLADTRRYLSGLNFATNFVFFREGEGHHTRLSTANYWAAYGASNPRLYCCLFDAGGNVLAEWREALGGAGAAVVIDSAEVARRFGLEAFTGQLFLHVLGAVGHDIVKYALDTYGDGKDALSATHDANSWPSELYAGLPAPGTDETVIMWVQNSHPTAIPSGAIGLNIMGQDEIAWLEAVVPGFGSLALDTRSLVPEARWPQQIEVRAGKHMVRPRYEVVKADGRRCIAHVNVERSDLISDPRLADLGNLMGKGFILPAPILPRDRYRSLALPTPMATCQKNLPVKLLAYDPDGREIGAKTLGQLPRGHTCLVDLEELLKDAEMPFGHMELIYDFSSGGEADGWLHSLFRYEDKVSGHTADTSFGAHMFNSVLTYRGEPQSYASRPPGLSTRLFLGLGPGDLETLCHLIYPASTPWREKSDSKLLLHNAAGQLVDEASLRIPCGGSAHWCASEVFSAAKLAALGDGGYIMIRDRTCRLFGYHGLINNAGAFSLDHMFGF